MSDASNPQLTPGWTVQNQGGPNASSNPQRLDLVASEGSGLGGGDAGSGVTPAAYQAAVSAATEATVTGVTGTDAANLAKLSDVEALVTAHNALVAALQAAGTIAAS